MACSSSNAAYMIDVLSVPESILDGTIEGMAGDKPKVENQM